MNGRNTGLMVLGGAMVGIGAYWYLAKDKSCSEALLGGETSSIECKLRELLGLGCSWDGVQCVGNGGGPGPGACNFNGIRDCDGTELWECQNGYWQLLDGYNPDCVQGNRYSKCFIGNQGSPAAGMLSCWNQVGVGDNECYFGTTTGCPCDVGACDANTVCMHNMCFLKGNRSITIPDGGFYSCQPYTNGNVCFHNFDKPLIFTTIAGSLFWKWSIPLTTVYAQIQAHNPVDSTWRQIWTGMTIIPPIGTTGNFQVNAQFPANEAVVADALAFIVFVAIPLVNIHPAGFTGVISY